MLHPNELHMHASSGPDGILCPSVLCHSMLCQAEGGARTKGGREGGGERIVWIGVRFVGTPDDG